MSLARKHQNEKKPITAIYYKTNITYIPIILLPHRIISHNNDVTFLITSPLAE